MTSDALVEAHPTTTPMKLFGRTRGQLIGAGLGTIIFLVASGATPGTQRSQDLFIGLWGMFIGATIGGVAELRSQGRSAEIRQFLSSSRGFAPALLLVSIASWIGKRYYGSVGEWVGIVGVPLLAFLAERLWRRIMRPRQ